MIFLIASSNSILLIVLESITLSGDYKTVFENGESFSCSGLVVNAHYSDGTSREVYDYQVNDNFVRMNVPGRYTVFISYSENGVEVSASYVIRVKPRKYAEQELTSIKNK